MLKKLRKILAEDIGNQDMLRLNFDDIMLCLEPSYEKVVTRSGIAAFVPFKYAETTPQHVEGAGMTSKEALATLKRDIPHVAQRVDSKTFYRVINLFAKEIAKRQMQVHPDIDLVVYADSSSDMTLMLATAVSELMGVSVIVDAVLKRSSEEFEVDEEWFDEWAQGQTIEDVQMIRALLDKFVAHCKRAGRDAASKSIPFKWRQFFNTHTLGPNADDVRGKKVLVIDDNIDKGWTFAGVEKLLINAGVAKEDIVFAAGFDYSERSERS